MSDFSEEQLVELRDPSKRTIHDLFEVTQDVTEETKIFWSASKGYVIGNYLPEIKNHDGSYRQREAGVQFYEHIRTTTKDRVAQYIRDSSEFKVSVFECETLAEAQQRTKDHDAFRYGTLERHEIIEEATTIRTH